MLNYLIGFSFAALIAFSNSNAMEFNHTNEGSSLVYKAAKASAYVGLGLGITVLTSFLHEMGHGVTAKFLTGWPLNINIGGYRDKPPKYEIGCITIRGWDPLIGSISYKTTSSKINNILIYLAGPCAGSTSALLLASLSKNPIYKCICWGNLIVEILNLYPLGYSDSDGIKSDSDGAKIVQQFFDEKMTKKIFSIASHPISQYAVRGIGAGIGAIILYKMDIFHLILKEMKK